MFKNYIKITLRNLGRQKGYALINILAVAIGIACFILIALWVFKGEPESALADRYSVGITEATAERYFGKEELIGKMVYSRESERNFKVTGVIKNVPKNSSMQFDIVNLKS